MLRYVKVKSERTLGPIIPQAPPRRLRNTELSPVRNEESKEIGKRVGSFVTSSVFITWKYYRLEPLVTRHQSNLLRSRSRPAGTHRGRSALQTVKTSSSSLQGSLRMIRKEGRNVNGDRRVNELLNV